MSRSLVVAGVVIGIAALAGVAGARPQANVFALHQLVADSGDPSLVNGWGLVAGPTTPWWTSNNGTNTSTLYNGAGTKSALTVSVPGGPTGIVFNGNANDFAVTQNGKTGAARFIFATEGGQVVGWSRTVNGTVAIPGSTARRPVPSTRASRP